MGGEFVSVSGKWIKKSEIKEVKVPKSARRKKTQEKVG